ncbi:hypothetical protein THASP1DRAFT_25505 [Thamnocephalis sphaerospora]|uniref:Uncharacterized protein n=1 Tax=Thamnocephalis sphaerospora TaxID=78915 RepID=A0A4P9XK33_9FUNG|nr:hypothetical protein THASP1DRAFT_25505 [Thamnocephalis sphaerospora]|eukprot:RKP06112.1 hypothetical protein THASP1DRAFT_25505 [Thamnocephalis sphaerospora]
MQGKKQEACTSRVWKRGYERAAGLSNARCQRVRTEKKEVLVLVGVYARVRAYSMAVPDIEQSAPDRSAAGVFSIHAVTTTRIPLSICRWWRALKRIHGAMSAELGRHAALRPRRLPLLPAAFLADWPSDLAETTPELPWARAGLGHGGQGQGDRGSTVLTQPAPSGTGRTSAAERSGPRFDRTLEALERVELHHRIKLIGHEVDCVKARLRALNLSGTEESETSGEEDAGEYMEPMHHHVQAEQEMEEEEMEEEGEEGEEMEEIEDGEEAGYDEQDEGEGEEEEEDDEEQWRYMSDQHGGDPRYGDHAITPDHGQRSSSQAAGSAQITPEGQIRSTSEHHGSAVQQRMGTRIVTTTTPSDAVIGMARTSSGSYSSADEYVDAQEYPSDAAPVAASTARQVGGARRAAAYAARRAVAATGVAGASPRRRYQRRHRNDDAGGATDDDDDEEDG